MMKYLGLARLAQLSGVIADSIFYLKLPHLLLMSMIIDMHLYGHARNEQKRGTGYVVFALLILRGLTGF
jgi:hypothetical protein